MQLYVVVAAGWTLCVVFSLLWLRWFAVGPAEWLWRAGIYGSFGIGRRAP